VKRSIARLHLHEYAAALADAAAAVELDPKNADAFFVKATSENLLGDMKSGSADIAKARALDPSVDADFRHGISR
jgi:Tfp pilus assembly protein PilF